MATFVEAIRFIRLAVEELYGTRYQRGFFSFINVGSGFRCLHGFLVHTLTQYMT